VTMKENDSVRKLQERYLHIHPMIFNRCCIYAKSLGGLYDILEDLPPRYPIKWDDKKGTWVLVNLKELCKQDK
jgi:hypothetical protein